MGQNSTTDPIYHHLMSNSFYHLTNIHQIALIGPYMNQVPSNLNLNLNLIHTINVLQVVPTFSMKLELHTNNTLPSHANQHLSQLHSTNTHKSQSKIKILLIVSRRTRPKFPIGGQIVTINHMIKVHLS